jgi:hypothetical protein
MLNFDFNANPDLDPALPSIADPDPTSRKTDSHPQPWAIHLKLFESQLTLHLKNSDPWTITLQ